MRLRDNNLGRSETKSGGNMRTKSKIENRNFLKNLRPGIISVR